MQKTISLNRIFTLPKLKNSKKVYDKEWNIFFLNEEERINFRKKITEAEKNILQGKYYTQYEVDKYFFEKYGI